MTDVSCVCGKTFIIEDLEPNMKITSCPWCPTDDTPTSPAEVRYNFNN